MRRPRHSRVREGTPPGGLRVADEGPHHAQFTQQPVHPGGQSDRPHRPQQQGGRVRAVPHTPNPRPGREGPLGQGGPVRDQARRLRAAVRDVRALHGGLRALVPARRGPALRPPLRLARGDHGRDQQLARPPRPRRRPSGHVARCGHRVRQPEHGGEPLPAAPAVPGRAGRSIAGPQVADTGAQPGPGEDGAVNGPLSARQRRKLWRRM
mmetsp:Transcript_55480/g.154561  ORF Transcript_55480/g.154561 Transcript_55480/m.154561 type:complete len:209 (+) Transcript_55480:577-1203(+)